MEVMVTRAAGGCREPVVQGLPAAVACMGVEDLEDLRRDVRDTIPRLVAKRGRLEDQIAAASRGRRRASSSSLRRPAPAPAAAADVVPLLPPPGGEGDDDVHGARYTRKGAGAVRRRLRAEAVLVKKEVERLQTVLAGLQEALLDAKTRRALQPGGYAAAV